MVDTKLMQNRPSEKSFTIVQPGEHAACLIVLSKLNYFLMVNNCQEKTLVFRAHNSNKRWLLVKFTGVLGKASHYRAALGRL